MSDKVKPFLKWAGSKYKIIDRITASLPPGNRLIEPFVGSGAVFLNTNYSEYIVADSNADLIGLYNCLKTQGVEFIQSTQQLFSQENNQPESFYSLRAEFNQTLDIHRKASIFVYLNRHCFNGLCRYNGSGKFNVPFGRYTKPGFPEFEMTSFLHKAQSVNFKVADFIDTMNMAESGDVVYCDPPYVPLSKTANFTGYTKAEFTLVHQQQLSEAAIKLMEKGVSVVISNHDTEFTRMIYDQAKIHYFDVQRFISSNAETRVKAPELLAIFSK